MNTEITYEYRDGANYRFHTSVVLVGNMTETQWARIRSCLSREVDGGFIADQVGLAEVFGFIGGAHIYSEEHKDSGYEFDEENDHCWHRFANDEDLSTHPTTSSPTDMRTAEQLVAAFETAARVGWRTFDPTERFGL